MTQPCKNIFAFVIVKTSSLKYVMYKHTQRNIYLNRAIYISLYFRNLDNKYNLLSLMTDIIYYFISFNSEVCLISKIFFSYFNL